MRRLPKAFSLPLTVGLLALALTGCGLWPFQGREESLQEATLPELLDRLESRTSGLDSLKALIALEVGGGQPFVFSLSWVRPDRMRLAGLSSFGTPLFEITVADGVVQWTPPNQAPVLLGTIDSLMHSDPVHAKGLHVTVDDLVRLMKVLTNPILDEGEYPVLEKAGRTYILYTVIIENGQARIGKRLFVDRRDLRLVRQDLFRPDGSVGIRLRYKEYRTTSHGEWPYRIIVEVVDQGTEMGLVFKELRFNPAIPSDEFRLSARG